MNCYDSCRLQILARGLRAAVLCALVSLLSSTPAGAADKAEGASPALADLQKVYESDVLPLLKENCSECHAGKKPKSQLNLATFEGVLKGAASGPVLVPGSAEQSLIIKLIRPGSDPHMPPEEQLEPEQIAALEKWVNSLPKSLAAAGEKQITDEDRAHWAFRPVQRPAVPMAVDATWGRTEIDAFIRAKQLERAVTPAPPAARLDLIRRATFDLTGVPPSQPEVEAFLADPSPNAYEKVLDRLLASNRYGERWGRHWLDLARYADSNGFEFDTDRPHAWRYRDYVIRSFNDDKPYDRFILEQLAGDELAPDDPEALTATGFCRHGPTVENQENEKIRLDEIDDILSTTSSVFLGLTIGCARCHDHKYDPIRQRDYYQMLAIFNSREKRELTVATPRELAQHTVQAANTDAAIERLRGELSALESKPPPEQSEADRAASKKDLERRIKELTERRPRLPVAMGIRDAGAQARPTHLLFRGDHRTPGPEVEPAVPAVLTTGSFVIEPPPASNSTGRRLALARWIASPENPLTPRVMVNRVWQYHFGRGLVETSSNFGLNGTPPTHPELLDWLAAEYIAQGWRLKPLHKLLMTSAVYMQSTENNPASLEGDVANTLWWRYPPRRLDAEEIRDAILISSGKLNAQMFGPGVKPRIDPGLIATGSTAKWPVVEKEGPEHWRRSVYVFVKRSVMMPMLEGFDAPTTQQTCERRLNTTVATQALQLLNNPFTHEHARYLAERVLKTAGKEPAAQIDRIYWLTLSRPPTDREQDLGRTFLAEQKRFHEEQLATKELTPEQTRQVTLAALTDLCHVMYNLNEFVYAN